MGDRVECQDVRLSTAFLLAVGEASPIRREWTEWFLSLPLWLDLGNLRIVHACWDATSITSAEKALGGALLTHDTMPEACPIGSAGKSSFAPDRSRTNAGSDLLVAVKG